MSVSVTAVKMLVFKSPLYTSAAKQEYLGYKIISSQQSCKGL